MAKSKEVIKEQLSTDLFKSGIANNYITVNNDGSYITYHCKSNTRRKLCNPEEFVQATAYLKHIIDYNYSPLNVSVNENVQVGSSTKEADILVYNEKNSPFCIKVSRYVNLDPVASKLSWSHFQQVTPIDFILCAGKNEGHIELMQLMESNIRVAKYLTILPDKHLLECKLKQAISRAKSKLDNAQIEEFQ